jgi:hypothetical protein
MGARHLMTTDGLRRLSCVAAALGLLIPSAADAADGAKNPHCVPVGGTVMTNFISETATLGTATGDLRGAVSATLLGQAVEGDAIVFTVQHHWVTETGATILMAPAPAKTRPLPPQLYAILSYPVTITGGTGRFDGASGHLDFVGELDASTGRTGFRYQGEVCFAAPAK